MQKKIARECRYREVTVIKHLENKDIALRPFKIFKAEHFSWLYERLHLDKTSFDIYISNASVRLPALPSNPNELKDARAMVNKLWKDWLADMTGDFCSGYDYYVDLDAQSPDDGSLILGWANTIAREMPKKNTIEIWMTGSGGAHIVEKGKFAPQRIKENVDSICKKHGIPLRHPDENIWNEKPFCDNTVWDWRRIRRVPFSIHSKYGVVMKRVRRLIKCQISI